MRKVTLATIVLASVISMGLVGCGEKSAGSAQEAIEQSKTQNGVEAQVNYLAGQAKSFLSQKNYDDAVAAANHILSNLDSNSKVAKEVLEEATAEIQKAAQGAVKDLQKSIGGLGK